MRLQTTKIGTQRTIILNIQVEKICWEKYSKKQTVESFLPPWKALRKTRRKGLLEIMVKVLQVG
jgi:hypothetical protein